MNNVGQKERLTQDRVVTLFRDVLGYKYLGNWIDREGNANVDEALLTKWLKGQGHDEKIIEKVLRDLNQAGALFGSKTLYDANREVYRLLRYGVKVRPDGGEQHITVWLIDWTTPENNEFAIAQEVTIIGQNTKRPDIVLYVNGVALGVLELKRSVVSVTEGIRQNLDNQKMEFIQPFFATVQLVIAGSDAEGLRYGVIATPEKYYRSWKEPSEVANPLDRALRQMCSKERLLEIVHDFTVFDAGVKKICRHNQYFGVHAAQVRVKRREGGIVWHTQGSGKSLTMVWLAKWIRENIENSRVLLITDRTELDEQIEKVFKGVSEDIYRTESGEDLVNVLNRNDEWLVCSLVHKFGSAEEGDVDSFIQDIQKHLPQGFHAKGDIFVFVDECHRTQSGKLHHAMKAVLPSATFIGFTGTPLLKKDKQKSVEVFGPYIHTYKYDEAVADGVILDLRYEARDIDQSVGSQEKVDQWFENRTQGLNDVAKAQLKRRWGTMQKVLSSRDRLEKIVSDIWFDMRLRPRLMSGHGNAVLVSGDIYSACRFFEMFQRIGLAGKCAIVTSYKPGIADIKGEESGAGETENILKYDVYRKMLASHFNESEDIAVSKVEQFEREVKKSFVDEPGQMKLLIVVDKLLTGFDAPHATYLYIDKRMRDHGLFQAICRVNRLDGEDKEYGYIVDYKDLFKSLEKSLQDYTGEAFDGFDAQDVQGLLKNRLGEARERLEERLESVRALCEPVKPPRGTMEYFHYFCASDSGDDDQLVDNEPKRVALYKRVSSLLRAYADLANDMEAAGYTKAQAETIKFEVKHYESVRKVVKLSSGDYIDMKMYEPDMRHLLDAYIRAEDSKEVSSFDDLTLVDLLMDRGEKAIDALPMSIRQNHKAVAETIENNMRRVIIDELEVNPKYYERMSKLLDELIRARKKAAIDYKAYLADVVTLAGKLNQPEDDRYPPAISTGAQRALFDNLNGNSELTLLVDEAIRTTKKADWHGTPIKEREVRLAIKAELGDDDELVETIFDIAKRQRDY